MTGRSRNRYTDREVSSPDATLEEAGRPPDSDPPITFDPAFVSGAAIVIGVFAAVVLAPLVYRLYDPDATDAVDRMAILTSMALLIVGIGVLLSGVYIALIEVGGRLRPRADQQVRTQAAGAAANPSLRGAIRLIRSHVVVLFLAGCVPLIAAAWVAESGVDRQSGTSPAPTSRTRTPSPAPSGSVTPTP